MVSVQGSGLPSVWITILLAWHAALSLAALLFYGWDKRAAINGTWRVPEARLHLLALLGGWPGALLAMRLFRHKSRKGAFVRVFWVTVVVHLAALIAAMGVLKGI